MAQFAPIPKEPPSEALGNLNVASIGVGISPGSVGALAELDAQRSAQGKTLSDNDLKSIGDKFGFSISRERSA